MLYRARQFSNAFRGITDQERALVDSLLSPSQRSLFFTMNRLAQRHALDVCHKLMAMGYQDEDILRAALLHDVAKGRIGPLPRALWVLGGLFFPGLLELMAKKGGMSWRKDIFLELHHPQGSATLAQETGASGFVVELIRRHQDKDVKDPILLAFQAADDES